MSKSRGRSTRTNDNPKWWDELLIKTRIAHSFVLHFNTMDYASPEAPTRLPTYLARKLSQCEIVATYSLNRGITFPLESMRQRALEILGLANKDQVSNGPTLDALRLVGVAPPVDERGLPRSPVDALPLLDKLLRTPRPQRDGDGPPPMVAVIIERAELIVPDADLAAMSLEDRTALATAGTGKSIMAEAVAKEAGVNAVRLRIGGQIASRWQGEGERNLEKALRAIASLAPTIVFMDEIDQAVKRGGDGGSNEQDQRIFQRLLEFMADTSHRGEIVFMATTNRPDLMDAALRRPGRFDKKVPFLISSRDERDAVFKVMARRYLGQEVEAPDEVLDSTEGWTGAEIEATMVKAAEIVEDEKVEPTRALSQAVQRLSPSTADIQLMTLLAVAECNDRDLLPPKYREMLDDRAALADKVKAAREHEGQLGRRRINL